MTPDAGSLPLLRALHERVFGTAEVSAVLDAAFDELAAELRERKEPPHATRVIPIDLFTGGMPPEFAERLRLCRAFLLRRGSRMCFPEVHRNSVQRLVSYRGSGWIRQGGAGGADGGRQARSGSEPRRGPGALTGRELHSPASGAPVAEPLERCWDIVPAGVWHYPEAGNDGDWATVTFHSASEGEILDEQWEGR